MKRPIGFVAAALLGFSGCSSSHTAHMISTAPPNAPAIAIGMMAPAFTATTLAGKSTALSDFKGKILVLNFWATWCPPCRAETPDMIRAYTKLASSQVQFLGIDTTETAPVVKSFVTLEALPYPVALAGADMYDAYGIAYIPTTFVIDAHGVVRARWTGGVTPTQLADYVAGARAGKNVSYVTAEQRTIDAMVATASFHFTGSPATIAREAIDANKRIGKLNAYLAKLNSGPTLRYDPARTQAESGRLELAIATAQLKLAKTPKQRRVAEIALAQGYGDLNRYADAVKLYRSMLRLAPRDAALVGALGGAYYRLHDYDAMASSAERWTKLAPKNADAWDQLGLANQRRAQFSAAIPAYQRAVDLMIASAKKQPIGKDGSAVAYVADESLDFANVYVSLGDARDAKRIFTQAEKYAALIPAKGAYADLKARVPERAVEGMTGVSLAHGDRTTIALTKWTGANLAGSLTSTYRYRLIALGPAGKSVTLTTKGLKTDWIASFCQDRLCSPGSVTFSMPPEGVKTYEFQLVPPQPNAIPGKVFVGTGDSMWVSTPQ